MLEVDGIDVFYGQLPAVRGVSLSLPDGGILAVIGANGAGKSTLLKAIAGQIPVKSGRIRLDGTDVTTLPAHRRARLGISLVPEGRRLFKSLTVHENLTAVERPGKWNPQRVYEMFPRLAERKTNLGTQLSGGEQQMLAVGRALVLNPKLLLLDEPLEGLAPIIVEELLRAIRRITQDEGLAAIIVEQHPQAILAISDQAVVLDHGTVVHADSAAALRAQPEVLERLLGVAR